MHYFGGKYRIRNEIAGYLSLVRGDRAYWEPFVGAGWVLDKMRGERWASDIHPELMAMWGAIQDGWVPPDVITEEDYYRVKEEGPDYLAGFVGFGCSWGGKWFGGYARDNSDRNYAKNAHDSILKKNIDGVRFFCADFIECDVPSNNMLIYCDPPYAGATGYSVGFDSSMFWDRVRQLSTNHIVVVSEYKAPKDFSCVLEIKTKTDIDGDARVEKLFRCGDYENINPKLF